MIFLYIFFIFTNSKYIVNIESFNSIDKKINYEILSEQHILIDDNHLNYFNSHKKVKFIENNKILNSHDVCNHSWGADRINQYNLPLDNNYDFIIKDSSNIDIYVIDTGIDINHTEFSDNKPILLESFGSDNPNDCDGHGTHVAGIISGKKTGIAKNANIFSIKIDHDCQGHAYCSDMIKAVNLVINRMSNNNRKSIINLSYSICKSVTDKLNSFMSHGGIVILSAGNDGIDISNHLEYKIFDIDNGLIVGATDKDDKLAYYSNRGNNVYMYAPGDFILSANYNDDNNCIIKSGTSMAAPFVTAITALYWNNKISEDNEDIIYSLIKYSNKNKIITSHPIYNNLIYLTEEFSKKPKNSNFLEIFAIFIIVLIFCIIMYTLLNTFEFGIGRIHPFQENNNDDEIELGSISQEGLEKEDPYENHNKVHVINNLPIEGESINLEVVNDCELKLKVPYDEENYVDEKTPVSFA